MSCSKVRVKRSEQIQGRTPRAESLERCRRVFADPRTSKGDRERAEVEIEATLIVMKRKDLCEHCGWPNAEGSHS